jgi:hypothetical protein
MSDDYTDYDDIYLPINTMAEYNELKRLLDKWIWSLDELDRQNYDTHSPRIRIERVRSILSQMDRIVLRPMKIFTKPWETLGITRNMYYYRRRKQFNGE